LLLRHAAPSAPPAVAAVRIGLLGLDAAGKELARRLGLAKLQVSLAEVVEALRVVFPALDITLEGGARFFVSRRGEIGSAYLAPDFAFRVLVVAADNEVEVLQRLLQASLSARNTAQLIARVEFFRIDFGGAPEALGG